jgi:hypothetical protein
MKRVRPFEEDVSEFERIPKKSRHFYLLANQQSQYEENMTQMREMKKKMEELEARIILIERMLSGMQPKPDKWRYYIS